jgi:hypothetical protein
MMGFFPLIAVFTFWVLLFSVTQAFAGHTWQNAEDREEESLTDSTLFSGGSP